MSAWDWVALVAWLLSWAFWFGLFCVVVDSVRREAVRVMKRVGEHLPGRRYTLRALVIVLLVVAWPACVVHQLI